MSERLKAHILLFTVALIYGMNYNIAKGVMPTYLQPFGFIVIRVIGGTILFWILHALTVREKVKRWQDYLYLAVCGFFGVMANQLLFFKGLSLTTPVNASVIMTIVPIIVLIVSYIWLKDPITKRKVIGILLGLTGAIWLIGGESFTFRGDQSLGNLFILMNATSYSIYLVLVKPLMSRYHPYTVTKWIFFFGIFGVVPFGWQEFMQIEWSQFPIWVWGAVLYVVVGTTFLAYLLNAVALQKVSASLVGFYIYFQPLIAGIIAVIIGQDVLSLEKVLASSLVFLGVFFVNRG